MPRGRALRHIPLALVLAGGLGCPPGSAAEAPLEQASGELGQLRARIETLRSERHSSAERRTALLEELRQAEQEIDRITQELYQREQDLQLEQNILGELAPKVERQRQAVQRERELLADQIRAAHAMGRQERLKLLLSQKDPAMVSRMLVYYDYLNLARGSRVAGLKLELDRLQRMEREVGGEEARVAGLREDLERERAGLEHARRARGELLAALEQEIQSKDQMLLELESDGQRLQKLVEQLAEESKRAEARRIEEEKRAVEAARLAEQRKLEEERRRVEAERQAAERKVREEEEARREQERRAKRLEQELAAKEKAEREKAEQERIAQERAIQERIVQEKLAQERIAQEKNAQEKSAQERSAQEKLAQEQAERERLAKEQEEKARQEKAALAQQKLEQERQEQERLAQERQEQERLEQARRAQEEAERQAAAERERAPPAETSIATGTLGPAGPETTERSGVPSEPAGTIQRPASPSPAEEEPAQEETVQQIRERLSRREPLEPVTDPFPKRKGRMQWPVQGGVVAEYGSPRAGWQQWDGVVLEVPEGGEVIGVHPGKVVFADWMRGYGQLLIIDHGDGYMTLYGNNQTLLKKKGEEVAAGETIALAGGRGEASGGSQGGIYFGIRHGSAATNPSQWLAPARN